MTLNLAALPITSSITLPTESRMFVITTSSAITLTLPNIRSRGLCYTISNQVNNENITITASVANTIRFSTSTSNDVTSFVMKGFSTVEITYYETYWIVGSVTNNSTSGSSSLASCTCNSNNLNPYTLCDGGSNNLITRITMNSNLPPSVFTVCIYNVSASAALTGEIIVSPDSTMATKIISIPVNNIPTGFTLLTNSILLNSTVYANSYYVGWKPSTGNASNKFGITSIRLT